MYDAIKMNQGKNFVESSELFNLDAPNLHSISENQFYSEAVFANGKEKLLKIVEIVAKIKASLEVSIKHQEESSKADGKKRKVFDPEKFWKSELFKELEDEFQKTFGFRSVEIQPLIEKYNSKKGEFESCDINAWVYSTNRYFVEGLVTDDGFYDKSHSLTFSMVLTLGIIKLLEPEELVAVILHEFGHKVDPALTSIQYTETNILSKYLTDRTNSLTENEKKFMAKLKSRIEANKSEFGGFEIVGISIAIIYIGLAFYILYQYALVSSPGLRAVRSKIAEIENKIFNFLVPKKIRDKMHEKRMKKFQKKLTKILEKCDKDIFKRQNYSEAYADNFARMYGYGPELVKGLHKMNLKNDEEFNSYVLRDSERTRTIILMTKYLLNDEHKTDVHRVRNLIREYKKDIEDPNTPAVVKKQLEADVKELEIILDKYLNESNEFQNKANQMINDNISKLEEAEDNKNINESTTIHRSNNIKNARDSQRRINASMDKFFPIGKKAKFKDKSKDNKVDNKDDGKDKEVEEVINRKEELVKLAFDDIFNETKKPSIHMDLSRKMWNKKDDDPEKRTVTKIGGIPYWPNNMKWPEYNGKPLICIAQLNFEELPKLPDFPTKGILQFFVCENESDCFISDNIDGEKKNIVIYHDKILPEDEWYTVDDSHTTLNKDVWKVGVPFSGVSYPTFRLEEIGINFSDKKWDELYLKYINKHFDQHWESSKDIPNEIWHLMFKNFEKIDYAGTRIGGNPYFCQEDMRKYRNVDTLLLQIDSEGGIIWGDCGIANAFISSKDLKKKDFSKVYFTWDCF